MGFESLSRAEKAAGFAMASVDDDLVLVRRPDRPAPPVARVTLARVEQASRWNWRFLFDWIGSGSAPART